jgi:nitroreductase
MNVEAAIRGRRSIRKFTSDPVSEETIRDILELAQWAPSWANTQPWNVFVVTGETLEKIRTAYRERAGAKVERAFEISRPRPDWPPELAARTKQLMAARASNDGGAAAPTSADFFCAPCLLLVAIDERLQPEYACFDTGLLVQTVCLAAHGRGLGTCIMAMAVGYPDVLHALVPVAAGKRFVVGVALGVPDLHSPINRFDRPRAGLSEVVSFVR